MTVTLLPPPGTVHSFWILFSTMKTKETPQILPLPVLTLCMSRRAIYTCPARPHLWLVHPRCLFRPTASHGWTFDQDEPPAEPPQLPSCNQEGFASKMEVAMGERAGLDRRMSHRTQQSGSECECEFSVTLCFNNEVQHGYLRPQVHIRLALPTQHLARCIQLARFTPFRAILQIQIRQFMRVLARECFQGFGHELGVPR